MRMELDVTGDGKSEVFLSNTARTGNGGGPWVVYSPRPDGAYVLLAELGFHGRFFRYDSESSLFVAGGHVSAEETTLRYFRVDDTGFSQLGGGMCPGMSPDCYEELDRIRSWQNRHAPPLYFLDVEQFRSDSSKLWLSKQTESPVELPSLAERRITLGRDK
jgi:hypothetical protein